MCFSSNENPEATQHRGYIYLKKRVQTTRQRCYELGMTRNPVVSVSQYVWLHLLFVYTSNWQCFVLAGFIQMRLYTYLLHHTQKIPKTCTKNAIPGHSWTRGQNWMPRHTQFPKFKCWRKIWVRQLGSSFPIYGKIIQMFQSTIQHVFSFTLSWEEQYP
jgi:hypothetical protein